jgi:hypothetical protein
VHRKTGHRGLPQWGSSWHTRPAQLCWQARAVVMGQGQHAAKQAREHGQQELLRKGCRGPGQSMGAAAMAGSA